MHKQSAGILLYHVENSGLKVLLVHPGGPFWAKKDAGVWSIPKGEFEAGESPLDAAWRELEEETGAKVRGETIELTPIKQKSGKIVYAWAVEGKIDADKIISNTFEMEWPPHSGKRQSFPEVDRAAWFTLEEAKEKLVAAQVALVEELAKKLKGQ